MKKIISISLILFIFSCDSDSGGETFNCPLCPNDSLSSLIDLNESNNAVTCNYSEISNLGCVNVIEAEVNEDNQTFDIYYNTDFDIAGFQFQINGLTITDIDYETYITSANEFSATYNPDNGIVIAFKSITTGEAITDRCGMLMRVSYTSPVNNPWNSSDFISDITFASEVNENDNLIPTQPDVCYN